MIQTGGPENDVMNGKIFVFGASGHSKVVIDAIEKQGLYQIGFLVDDNPALMETHFYGYPVIGGKQELRAARNQIRSGIVAIGDNRARNFVASWLTENGFELVSAIHPSAHVGRGATVDSGTVVMAGAIINSDVRIGKNVIVNTCASIDHDCSVGDGVHIAPGVTLCGSVRVGSETLVGAGSVIIPNQTIGSNVVIGAGSVVIRDIPDGSILAGSPAKAIHAA